jgi:imidazole glycerol phosphate synthase glutamine amidotransferase subunit
MGNLRSVAKALEAAGSEVTLTSDPAAITSAGALCVPGQGIFGRCVQAVDRLGLRGFVSDWLADERPYLGICLGMQVLYAASEESPGCPGLGFLPGTVVRLRGDVRIPHIGWNTVGDEYYYFDHSYAVVPEDEPADDAWCEHGIRFAARIVSGNLMGVQFHPEKSGAAGIELLKGWIATI